MAVFLDPVVAAQFADLKHPGKLIAEYVWIGGSGSDLRSKGKVIDSPVNSIDELPLWNFDGSSTGQAPGHDSEVLLKPVRLFPDPFRGAPHQLVICEVG